MSIIGLTELPSLHELIAELIEGELSEEFDSAPVGNLGPRAVSPLAFDSSFLDRPLFDTHKRVNDVVLDEGLFWSASSLSQGFVQESDLSMPNVPFFAQPVDYPMGGGLGGLSQQQMNALFAAVIPPAPAPLYTAFATPLPQDMQPSVADPATQATKRRRADSIDQAAPKSRAVENRSYNVKSGLIGRLKKAKRPLSLEEETYLRKCEDPRNRENAQQMNAGLEKALRQIQQSRSGPLTPDETYFLKYMGKPLKQNKRRV